MAKALDPQALAPAGVLLAHQDEGFSSRVLLLREPRLPLQAYGDDRAATLLADLAQGRAVRYALRAEVTDDETGIVGSSALSAVQDTADLKEGRQLAALLLLTAAEVWREAAEANKAH